mmetsp:Transcript_18215/g.20391  ORF Transcript_18215/g.20391 Transcript_18215/m.20391 type:complete len:100 (+) Transcript_18215:592-891(+)
MDEAEKFLIKLGESLYKFRNLEDDQNDNCKNSSEEEVAPVIHPKRLLRKKLVKKNKRRKVLRRESKRLMNISSKLFELECNLLKDKTKENKRKLTHDIT